MYKLILLLLLLQFYNSSIFGEPWSPALLEEFRTFAKEISANDSGLIFNISKDLCSALFKRKGSGRNGNERIVTKDFVELGNLVINCQYNEGVITFQTIPKQNFKGFLRACIKNGEYRQPKQKNSIKVQRTTLDSSSVHQESSFLKQELKLKSSTNLPEPLFCTLDSVDSNQGFVPQTGKQLQIVLNESYNIRSSNDDKPVVHKNESQNQVPLHIADECQLFKITNRRTTKRNFNRIDLKSYTEDIEKYNFKQNLDQVMCLKNRIYFLSSGHIVALDHNLKLQKVCSPHLPPKHFLPMDSGDFITTSIHDEQWILHHHKPSGIIVSLPVANLEIISLTAVNNHIVALLTDGGIFLCKITSKEPVLEFYYKLEGKYCDITCKNMDDNLHFFIANSEHNKIEEIYQYPTMKRASHAFSLEHEVDFIKYDGKNNCLLIADKKSGYIRTYSCTLDLIYTCIPLTGLRSFSIDNNGSIFCICETIREDFIPHE